MSLGCASVGECPLRNQSDSWAGSATALRALAATTALDGVVLGRVSPGAGRTRNRRSVSPHVRAEQSEGSAGTNDRGTQASVSKSVVGTALGCASVRECPPSSSSELGSVHQAYACGASPGPGQISSSRSIAVLSSCTESAPRLDIKSSVVVGPMMAVETTGFRRSHAKATCAGGASTSRHNSSCC